MRTPPPSSETATSISRSPRGPVPSVKGTVPEAVPARSSTEAAKGGLTGRNRYHTAIRPVVLLRFTLLAMSDALSPAPSGPLKGITLIELAGIGPGPFAGMLLADMGADVIRIERAQAVPATPPNRTNRWSPSATAAPSAST